MRRCPAIAAAGLVALLATGLAAQCNDPLPPPGGFLVQDSGDRVVRLSDGYRTTALMTWPRPLPGRCGWPLVVLVPGLGADRRQTAPEAALLAREGYFVVSYDVRGQASARTLNPGRGSQLWALDEWIDLAEIIEWTSASFPGVVDGSRVAVVGDSQGGVHAWAAAAWSGKVLPPSPRRTSPFPRIRCVVPRIFPAQVTDVFVPAGKSFFYRLAEYAWDDALPAVELDPQFRASIASYLVADDPQGLAKWWRSIPGKDFTAELQSSRVPVLHHAAWLDVFAPPDLALAALEMLPPTTPRRVYVGTGLHYTALNAPQAQLRHDLTVGWLGRWLKATPEPIEAGPPVLAAALPADARGYRHLYYLWRHRADARLPVADAALQRFYLRSAGRLRPDAPVSAEGPGVLTHHVADGYDSRSFFRDGGAPAVVQRSIPLGKLVFETDVLSEDLEIAGSPSVELDIRPTSPDWQVGVRLLAVAPDDVEQLLSDGGTSERQFDTRASMPVRVPLSTTMSVVPRGYRLRLEVLSQVIHTPNDVDYYRVLPCFRDFALTIGYQPGRLSWLEVPQRPRVRPDLALGEHAITVAKPEVRLFAVSSAAANRGQPYIVLMSLSGQAATWITPLDPLYLTMDTWTIVGIDLLASPAFAGFVGVLDAAGQATARLDLGLFAPLPGPLRGYNLHLAPLVFDTTVESPGAPVVLRFQ